MAKVHDSKTKRSDDEALLSLLESRGIRFLEYSTLRHDSRAFRDRSKREATSSNVLLSFKMRFTYAKEHYEIEFNNPQQILHPSAEVLTFTNGSVQQWLGAHPDCFLTGTVTSHSGVASLSFCDKIVGLVKTRKHALYLESISEIADNDNLQIIIGQQTQDEISNHVTKRLDGYNGARTRRSLTSHNITIEMAVYIDAAYTQTMLVTDFSKRLQHILLKYYAVQMEWSRADMLDYNVQIVLKKVHFFEENPAWYNTSTSLLGSVLYQFCMATTGDGPFDIRYMHVGLTNLDVLGRAYQNSVCNPTYNCAVDTATGAASFAATAHEIGHLLGMYHDADRGCTGNNIGLMGGFGTGWSSCSKEDMAVLLNSGNKNCLWEENIPLEDVPESIANVTLISAIPGQIYSPDQVCELKYGTGYQFRKYPKLGVCVLYSCANHNSAQINYGQMFKEWTSIFGMYCEKDKICFKMGCVDASAAKLTNLMKREGGWSQWGPWTGCTRTCGRGINYRKRKCDNPAPINLDGCAGEAYEAKICNTQPCAKDSSDELTLRNQRASETCKRLRDNNVIDPDLYNETGSRYSDTAHGQCEVTCDPAPGHTIPTFTRFGFIPDGVACTGGSDPWDLYNWPRNSGSRYLCLDGLCQRFGCDNQLNGQVLDECGVCGGDNSTCIVIANTDTEQQIQGERRTLAVLPAGTFNIQFWFPYKEMADNYLELYSKHGSVILASRIPSSWVWDARSSPVVFAGTEWYYFFYGQYLYAKGPLTESCEIKLFQFGVNNNTGVSFTYSEPLAEYFIHMSSLTTDKTATISKQNIHGTSYDQYLSLSYHVTGIGSKITVSLHGGINTSVLWSSVDSSQLVINEWKSATMNITTFEKYEIRITCETKVQHSGTISLDDLKLSYYEDSYCNDEDSCVTPSLDLSTSTTFVSTTKSTFTTPSTTVKEDTTNPVASTTTNLHETTTKIKDITETTTSGSETTPVSPTITTESTSSITTLTSTKATSMPESTTTLSTGIPTTTETGTASSETTAKTSGNTTTVSPVSTTETVATSITTTMTTTTSVVTETSTQKTTTKLTTLKEGTSTSTTVSASTVTSSEEITTAKSTQESTLSPTTFNSTSSSLKSTTPVSLSSTTTISDADSYGRYMFMGLAIAGPFILMLIAVGIFICCRRCSKCSPKGKSQEKYRVSKQFDGNSSRTDGSSKPLSPQFWPDVDEIKINITNDCDIDLGSKSEI
uniref:A disintegrin and metalloproteinase with thrombospondin motifs 2 n=1 Tax=Magallana gigas TaxID=29159 RepID=K1RDR5_MAGGI